MIVSTPAKLPGSKMAGGLYRPTPPSLLVRPPLDVQQLALRVPPPQRRAWQSRRGPAWQGGPRCLWKAGFCALEIAQFWHHGRRVEPNRGSGDLQTGLENVMFCFFALLSSTKQIKNAAIQDSWLWRWLSIPLKHLIAYNFHFRHVSKWRLSGFLQWFVSEFAAELWAPFGFAGSICVCLVISITKRRIRPILLRMKCYYA